MPPRSRGGGALKAGGSRGGTMIGVTVKVTGVEKTSDEFKLIRRDINGRMRDVMQRVGDEAVLPVIRAGFPRLASPMAGKQPGVMAGSLKIARERSGVFIGSSLRGPMNRALGWIDFGGKRDRDSVTRRGPKVIVRTLDTKRALIDKRVLDELDREFHAINNA